jgi:hypothetical protein
VPTSYPNSITSVIYLSYLYGEGELEQLIELTSLLVGLQIWVSDHAITSLQLLEWIECLCLPAEHNCISQQLPVKLAEHQKLK